MKRLFLAGLTLTGLGVVAVPVSAYSNVITWSGNGSHIIDSTFTLDHEICGIVNGAPVDGPYAYWVLTASRANNADINIDGSGAVAMNKRSKGSFHYLQDMVTWDEPNSVVATYDGPNTKRVTLTLSHGCTQEEEIG